VANPPSAANVKLLVHCDGSDGATTFTDTSGNAHALTAVGDAQVDSIAKFGTGSALFAGDPDAVSATLADDFKFGDGSFNVECWVRFDTAPSAYPAFITTWGESAGWSLYYNVSGAALGFDFQNQSDNYQFAERSWSPSSETWYHITAANDAGTLRLFVDGAQLGTSESIPALMDPDGDLLIGYDFVGRVDEVRIVKGEAVYTSGFTVSTAPFTDGEESDAYAVTASIQFGGADAYAVRAVIEIRGTESYDVTAEIEISAPTYTVTAAIRISGEETYAITAGIAIQGSAHTAANRQSIKWSPVVAIDGSDVSARVTAACPVEMNEDASNVATVTLIPATGPLEPLSYLGKTLTMTWSDEGDGVYSAHTVLMFTGTISDASWDPDSGYLEIEATSDMQGLVERMDRDSIATMIPGSTWSDIIFEQEADLWQYAQDLLSTTTDSLWQDAMGVLRIAPIAAKGSPDFTFTDAGRFSDTLQINTASIRDLVNQISITLDYRYPRQRHREIRCRWIGQQDICTFLINPYTLCTKDMVKSAADSADWQVVGDISYTEVWPPGAYQCGSGGKVYVWGYEPIVAQLDSYQDLTGYCIGATWRAARRYTQRVTETHSVVVQCQDSIDAVGRLPNAEDYGAESDVDTSDWDASDATAGPPAGATQLSSGDWALDVDGEGAVDRDAVDEALEVAMAAARGDILRSHRQTRVSFQTVFQPMLNLSHTVRVNADNLQATGKVSRLEHVLDSATGEATTTVEIAVSRHEGTGLSVSTPIAAPAKPTAPDGTVIPTYLLLRQYTGGSVADYLDPGFESDTWDEVKDLGGFHTNVLFDVLTQKLIGQDEVDPVTAQHVYQIQFQVMYPEISGAHIDAAVAGTTTTIEVAVPEDELVCTQ
jgi:hypothetical protein